ncbi:MAG TPA: nuclear transport factor 2 family protein [Pseudonocardia sp.]
MTAQLSGDQMEAHIRAYMDACTSGDADAIAGYFEPDGVHYFPTGMYGGPFIGARTIGERFAAAVREGGSAWTVDAVVTDEPRRQAVVEWTHFKRNAGVTLRGCEWYVYSAAGLIQEIRAYYASPQADGLTHLGLGGYDYEGRGYPSTAPRRG